MIGPDAGKDLEVLVAEDDFVLEELEPGRGYWTKPDYMHKLLAMAQMEHDGKTYHRRRVPFVQYEPIHGFSIPSSPPIAGPWCPQLQRVLRW